MLWCLVFIAFFYATTRADIRDVSSICQIGLSTGFRRARHERLVWDEPPFAALRMNSHTADKAPFRCGCASDRFRECGRILNRVQSLDTSVAKLQITSTWLSSHS